MELVNQTEKFDEFFGRDVEVWFMSSPGQFKVSQFCQTFVINKKLKIALEVDKNSYKYVLDLPEKASFFINNDDLNFGKYIIVLDEQYIPSDFRPRPKTKRELFLNKSFIWDLFVVFAALANLTSAIFFFCSRK